MNGFFPTQYKPDKPNKIHNKSNKTNSSLKSKASTSYIKIFGRVIDFENTKENVKALI
jgi:hypothetical protein